MTKRVTIEAFLHAAEPDSLDAVTFLKDQGGELAFDADTGNASVVFKKFLDEADAEKVLAWAEDAHQHAGSGKVVILVDYQEPDVFEWHDPEHAERPWREELAKDLEGLKIFIGRFEHLLHMG